jgi:acetyl-CoA C-acetyltransferase
MDTFIFDHVRTPRGRGKAGGSLHEVTPVWLASRPLVALAERNRLDTAAVEEVVMGCVGPVGEQGGNIGRIAVLAADWDQQVPGISIDRACGSGLEAVGFAASKVMAGQADLAVGAGVESLSRVPMGSSGGAWAQDPQMAAKTCFVMQGISADLLASLHGHSRTDLDAYAAESHRRAARAWSEGRFARSVVPVKDFIGLTLLERDETVRADTTIESLASAQARVRRDGQKYGYDGVALQRYPQLERIEHHAPCRQFQRHRRRCRRGAGRQRGRGARATASSPAHASGPSPPSAPSRR